MVFCREMKFALDWITQLERIQGQICDWQQLSQFYPSLMQPMFYRMRWQLCKDQNIIVVSGMQLPLRTLRSGSLNLSLDFGGFSCLGGFYALSQGPRCGLLACFQHELLFWVCVCVVCVWGWGGGVHAQGAFFIIFNFLSMDTVNSGNLGSFRCFLSCGPQLSFHSGLGTLLDSLGLPQRVQDPKGLFRLQHVVPQNYCVIIFITIFYLESVWRYTSCDGLLMIPRAIIWAS